MTTDVLPPDFKAPKRSKLKRAGGFFAMIAVGVFAMKGIASVEGESRRRTGDDDPLLVTVLEIEKGEVQAKVDASGVLSSAEQIVLTSEVGGTVEWVSPKLQPGARFSRGEALARVEATQFEAFVAAERVRLKQAELELTLERERGERALQDWQNLGNGSADSALATRRPHLELAEANLAAAQSSLRQAERNLERTTLRAPFNAVVVDETVDRGQVLAPGLPVAQLAGTDRYRSTVQIPAALLSSLDIPGLPGGFEGSEGSSATLRKAGAAASEVLPVKAHVMGMGGQLDPLTKMATILINVEPEPDAGSTAALLLGDVHEVTIAGGIREAAVKVPRSVVYEGSRVWVVDSESRLQARDVVLGWDLGGGFIEVREGLEEGDKAVNSPLSLPISGTLVRIIDPSAGGQ